MKKKIALLNFQHSRNNYGALLQAYALQEYLKEINFDPINIFFRPKATPSAPSGVIERLRAFVRKILPNKWLRKRKYLNEPDTAFKRFRSHYLIVTDDIYHYGSELFGEFDGYHAVIVGSDQVWRGDYIRSQEETFFLDFVDSSTLKVAYAASFGKSELDANIICRMERVSELLSDFREISIRESSGGQLLEKKFGIASKHVLDPTLLAGEMVFEKNMKLETKAHRYIGKLSVSLLDSDPHLLQNVDKISGVLRSDPMNIYSKTPENAMAVDEWLAAIKGSQYVITDSFHCVCFCILFSTPFLCVINENRGRDRLESLLAEFELDNNLVSNLCDIDRAVVLINDINFKSVSAKLGLLRERSVQFINDALVTSD